MGDTRQGGLLEPDRNQLEIFTEALFRYVGKEGFVSLRAFYEDGTTKPFRITPTSLAGGLKFLIDVAEDDARRAANDPRPVVFCPPLAVFGGKERATEKDLLAGPTLSVECDNEPENARTLLEDLLGPATVIVRSGGKWKSPSGAEQDKLHLHWRLAQPARGAEQFKKLKAARELAAHIVGGDPSNTPIVHPIRWPGSWHRKAEPRLCTIEAANPDVEIPLDAALTVLALNKNIGKSKQVEERSDVDRDRGRTEWEDAFRRILSGESYHPTVTPLAASFASWGAPEPVTDNVLRSLLINSSPQDPERQRRRDAELAKLPQTVASAYEKFAPGQSKGEQDALLVFNAKELDQMAFDPIKYVVPGYIVEGLTLLCGKPKIGKSWLLLHAANAVAEGGFTLGDVHCAAGDVLYAALEDGPRRLQSRMRKLRGTQPRSPRLHFTTEMPRLAQGGLDYIKKWIEGAKEPRLVIIDTLAMVRTPAKKDTTAYDADYAAVVGLRDLARQHGVAVVLVHHLRKADADDAFDTVSGTLGLTGAPDTVIIIRRDSKGITLHARGRDLVDVEKAMNFNPESCVWSILGDASEVRRSDERSAIVAALAEAGTESLGANQIASATGMRAANVRRMLSKMRTEGVVKKASFGKYTLNAGEI
jgi:AAA domain